MTSSEAIAFFGSEEAASKAAGRKGDECVSMALFPHHRVTHC